MSRPLAIALTLALSAAVAIGSYSVRRRTIQSYFARTDAAPHERPALPPASGPDLEPAPRTRVILLDGLDRRNAVGLPALSRACARGMELELDTGFPTVSLPVQAALWTGWTQLQAGVRYVSARLDPPPAEALPAQVEGSAAIAELHPYLVHSFGFALSEPEGDKLEGDAKTAWVASFVTRAAERIASTRRLVFVHVGRIDVAGHAHGRESAAYRHAAAEGDTMLAEWLAHEPGPDVRWFVLADHGHRAGGGHGGAEDAIRLVRACVFGSGILARSGVVRAHLVDLSRALFASVGGVPPPDAAGRPLSALASGSVALGTTVPRAPRQGLWLVLALGVMALLLTTSVAGRRWPRYPWWWIVAIASILLVHGAPTLSMPLVYPPRGQAVYVAAVPGLLVLAASLARMPWKDLVRAWFGQLLLPVTVTLALWIASGGVQALTRGIPPLWPQLTAWTSVLLVVSAAGASAAALAVLVRAGLSAFGRDSAGDEQRAAP